MASLRRLRRRELRWHRYEARVYRDRNLHHWGRHRAIMRRVDEQDRRARCPLCRDPWCFGDCFELMRLPPLARESQVEVRRD